MRASRRGNVGGTAGEGSPYGSKSASSDVEFKKAVDVLAMNIYTLKLGLCF